MGQTSSGDTLSDCRSIRRYMICWETSRLAASSMRDKCSSANTSPYEGSFGLTDFALKPSLARYLRSTSGGTVLAMFQIGQSCVTYFPRLIRHDLRHPLPESIGRATTSGDMVAGRTSYAGSFSNVGRGFNHAAEQFEQYIAVSTVMSSACTRIGKPLQFHAQVCVLSSMPMYDRPSEHRA